MPGPALATISACAHTASRPGEAKKSGPDKIRKKTSRYHSYTKQMLSDNDTSSLKHANQQNQRKPASDLHRYSQQIAFFGTELEEYKV